MLTSPNPNLAPAQPLIGASAQSIGDYLEYVQYLAETRQDKVFNHAGPFHSAAVMGTMFYRANDKVTILSGGFKGAISDRAYYLEGLTDFLSREGTALEVAVQNDEHLVQTHVYKILSRYSNKVTLYKTNLLVFPRPGGVDGPTENHIHFFVADDRMYRLETDTVSYQAECNFNNPVKSKGLVSLFGKIIASDQTSLIAF